ncbi:hypothetical protein TNCT_228781 [Trichonephila clavata]|uniref:Uncharacterized protein n=1 Tax=Trichonephila clavata TaxID=2740835 RepID=A0A8X6GGW1_TRICU|nr:hypothetical protein TNCT_228781 [Trichonephila clavata]
MQPLYRQDDEFLLLIHQSMYRNCVESCILNVPVGTEIVVRGDLDHFLWIRFVRTEEGFSFNTEVHHDDDDRFVSTYVSNPTEVSISTGCILTPEDMKTLILDGFPTTYPPSLDVRMNRVNFYVWTEDKVWKRPDPEWKLVGHIRWHSVLNPEPEGKKVSESFHEFLERFDEI